MTREDTAFKIKHANFPLFVLHITTTDMGQLKKKLKARLKATPDFFDGTPMVLGLAGIADSGFTPDFADLESFMRGLGIHTAGVVDGSPEQNEAAVKAGLGIFPEAAVRPSVAGAPDSAGRAETQPQAEEAAPETVSAEHESVPSSSGTKADSPEQPAAAPIFRPAMVIDKPVRTGQRIYAEGSDLVVLAVVNAGAELIADGDIHIYAPFRGRAIAGAHGNQSARIFVQRLEAELISIAGSFQLFESGVPENVRGVPAQVRLDGSRLIFEPLSG